MSTRFKVTGTVKGNDLTVGTVVKIGSRWYRVTGWLEPCRASGIGFVETVKHDQDPRGGVIRPRTRLVYAGGDYPVRDEPAPAWAWVTRKLEREAAEGWR